MKSTMHRLSALLVLALMASPLLAQETTNAKQPEEEPAPVETIEKTDYDSTYVVRKISFGAFAGYSLDFHSADLLDLPQVPSCCDGYNGGTGGGFVGGISMAFPMTRSIDLIGRLSFHTSSVTMTEDEPIMVRQGNEAVPAVITHELSPSLSILGLEPGIDWRLSEAFSITAGVRIASIMSASYEQREVLDPSIAYDYDGGAAVRNQTSGDIQDVTALQFGAFVGARYALPLDRSHEFHLIPEVQFAPMFTNVVDGQTWSVNSLRFMLNFTQTITSVEKRSSPLKPN